MYDLCSNDTDAEHKLIKEAALKAGADAAVVCTHWGEGGAGATELASELIKACKQPKAFKLLYDLDLGLEQKITCIAVTMYGAGKVELTDKAQDAIKKLTDAVSCH